MIRLIPRIAAHAADEALDRIFRNVHERIDQLQGLLATRFKLIESVELPDNTDVPVRHGLGRMARVFHSTPWAISGSVTTGHIRNRTRLVADKYDPTQYVVFQADDWGTTMYIDLLLL